MPGQLTFTRGPSLVRIQKILDLVAEQPRNVLALSLALPMSKRWVIEYLKHLHSEEKIHVLRWDKEVQEREKRHAIEVWAFGPGQDAPRPPADTKQARSVRAWERIKADEDRHDLIKAKRRVRRRIKARRPDIAASWITAVVSNEGVATMGDVAANETFVRAA